MAAQSAGSGWKRAHRPAVVGEAPAAPFASPSRRFHPEISGLALGYDHGRAAALIEAQRAPSKAAKALAGRLADLLGDTDAEPHDVLLAFVDALRIAVTMGRREPEVQVGGYFVSNA